jgi:SAM-dependent methyltransferase
MALGDGRMTIPGRPDFLETDRRLWALDRALGVLLGSMDGRRVADLGSLEGGFAVAMARRGATVVAVEARTANVDKINLLRDHFGLAGSIQVVVGDVKDVDAWAAEPFDVVMALGILYHLDNPVVWLRDVASRAGGILVLDTHVAPADDLAMARLRTDLRHLGRIDVQFHDGVAYEGRWFQEFAPTISECSRADQLWASWQNERSFWLTEEALLRALLDAGYNLVMEQHDLTARDYRLFSEEYPRAMYIALRA